MRVISLGSGSSGNALLVQSGETSVLVDAGFPLRLLAGRLRSLGIAPASLSAILLTHEHGDHACGALSLAYQHGFQAAFRRRAVTHPRQQSASRWTIS